VPYKAPQTSPMAVNSFGSQNIFAQKRSDEDSEEEDSENSGTEEAPVKSSKSKPEKNLEEQKSEKSEESEELNNEKKQKKAPARGAMARKREAKDVPNLKGDDEEIKGKSKRIKK